MAAIPVAVRSKNLCSTALGNDPLIPLLQLSSKSDSMFWKNTAFPSSSYFRKVFQKPPLAVRNVLHHHSPKSTFLVGGFEQQTPTAGTSAGWQSAAAETRTWVRWESVWCTGEERELLEQRRNRTAQMSKECWYKCSPAVQLLHLLDGARPVDPVWRCCGCGPLPRGGAIDMIHVEHSPMAVYPSFPI